MEVELAMLKQLGILVILWVHKRLEQCKGKGRLWTGKKGCSSGWGSLKVGRKKPKAE